MTSAMTQEPREFPETHWSQLLELADPANPNYHENLGRLILQYWKPVYHLLEGTCTVFLVNAVSFLAVVVAFPA